MKGDLGAALGILSGIATALSYIAWTVRQIRRAQRTVEQLTREHAWLMAAAHRHDKTTGRPVRLKPPPGGSHAR